MERNLKDHVVIVSVISARQLIKADELLSKMLASTV